MKTGQTQSLWVSHLSGAERQLANYDKSHAGNYCVVPSLDGRVLESEEDVLELR